jgi:hypothetical protein
MRPFCRECPLMICDLERTLTKERETGTDMRVLVRFVHACACVPPSAYMQKLSYLFGKIYLELWTPMLDMLLQCCSSLHVGRSYSVRGFRNS